MIETTWKTCPSCGLTHSRHECPRCGGRPQEPKAESDGGGGRALLYVGLGVALLAGFGVAGYVSIGGSYFLVKGLVLVAIAGGGALMKSARS